MPLETRVNSRFYVCNECVAFSVGWVWSRPGPCPGDGSSLLSLSFSLGPLLRFTPACCVGRLYPLQSSNGPPLFDLTGLGGWRVNCIRVISVGVD